MYRFTFASDIHASRSAYLKLLNSVNYYSVNALVIGGDITGKYMLPFVKRGSTFSYSQEGRKFTVEPEKLEATMNAFRDEGIYTAVMSEEELEETSYDHEKLDHVFLQCMKETLVEWSALAEKRLKVKGIPLIINFGNDDRKELDETMRSIENDHFIFSEDRIMNLGDSEMLSAGYANRTPWNAPRDVSEEEFLSLIEGKAAGISNMENAIFNIHCPPYGTLLDRAPRLDGSGKIYASGGHMQMVSVGSTAVREAIERYQPLLGLHGHIHESRGADRIGRTLCLNPGSEYQHGVLKFCTVTLDRGKVSGYLFSDG